MKFRKTLISLLLLAGMTVLIAACNNTQYTVEPVATTAATMVSEVATTSPTATSPAATATPLPTATPDTVTQPTPAMGQGQQHHGQDAEHGQEGQGQNMGHGQGQGQGMGHGHGGQGMGGPPAGMRERHQAPIPAEYQGKTNPIPADEASLARGEEIYAQQCATCHGDGGMGDGPAGQGLDPAPAPVAHSSQMLSDSYLFWRINEGGIEFQTAMIPYKNILSEDEIWDVINYIRALGAGQVQPRQNVGGQAVDPNAEAQMHADMLAAGVEQGIITQEEADLFSQVHDKLDDYKESHMDELRSFMGSPEDMQKAMIDGLVQSGEITQEEADLFTSVHDRLVEAGIMQ